MLYIHWNMQIPLIQGICGILEWSSVAENWVMTLRGDVIQALRFRKDIQTFTLSQCIMSLWVLIKFSWSLFRSLFTFISNWFLMFQVSIKFPDFPLRLSSNLQFYHFRKLELVKDLKIKFEYWVVTILSKYGNN